MTATGQNVSVPRGNSRKIRIPVKRGEEPYDLTTPSDHRFFYVVKEGGAAGDVVILKDSNSPGSPSEIHMVSSTEVEIVLTVEDTNMDPKSYYHELEVWHPDGSAWDAMQGELAISGSHVQAVQ